jgi:hypothetical protein
LSRKTESIQNQFKETHVTLIEDEADADHTKKSKDKALKKSTVEIMNFGSLKIQSRYCNHP